MIGRTACCGADGKALEYGEHDDDAPNDERVDDEAVDADGGDCKRKYLLADGRQEFYDIFI